MSQENVDTVIRGYEAFNEGDPSRFLDIYDPDIVLRVAPGAAPESGTFVGRSSVQQWFENFFSAFGVSFHVDVVEAIAVGDSVVAIQRNTARGRASGIGVEAAEIANVYTFRGGRIIRIDLTGSREEAFRTVGLGV